MADRMVERRAQVQQLHAAAEVAWRHQRDRTAAQDAYLDLEASPCPPPFQVHESHRALVLCGGFVGCRTCGSVRGYTGGRLQEECRGWVAKGGDRQVSLLLRGRMPWPAKTGWPSGEEEPRPRRWQQPGGEAAGSAGAGLR